MWKSFEEVVQAMYNEKTGRWRYNYVVANNTKLQVREEGKNGIEAIALRLHHTDILTFLPRGIVYNSGGFRTVTTRRRMNEFGPLNLFRKDYIWYVDEGVPYFDGMIIGYDGTPLHPTTDSENAAIIRDIQDMRKQGYAWAKTMTERYVGREQVYPATGDVGCAGCSAPNDADMRLSAALHILKGEFCPSLVRMMLRDTWSSPSPHAVLYFNTFGEWRGVTPVPKHYAEMFEKALQRWINRNLLFEGTYRLAKYAITQGEAWKA